VSSEHSAGALAMWGDAWLATKASSRTRACSVLRKRFSRHETSGVDLQVPHGSMFKRTREGSRLQS